MESRQGRRSGVSQGGKWLRRVFKSEKEGLFHERWEGHLRSGTSLFQGIAVLGAGSVVSERGWGGEDGWREVD